MFGKARRNATFINDILASENTQLGKCPIEDINLLWAERKTYIDLEFLGSWYFKFERQRAWNKLNRCGEILVNWLIVSISLGCALTQNR